MSTLNRSFFTFDTLQNVIQKGSLRLDFEVLEQISDEEIHLLSPTERAVLTWYKKEREKGLIDIHFGNISDDAEDQSNETLCTELLNIIKSKSVPDPELF